MKNIKKAILRSRQRDEWYCIKSRDNYNNLQRQAAMCDICGCDPCDCEWGYDHTASGSNK